MPLIAVEFHINEIQHGLVSAASLAGILVGALLLGGLADRFALGIAFSPATMRVLRSSLIDVYHEDYIHMARLRGLSERTLPDLHARLEDARLLDADPEIERLRNIVVSPLDDLDPEALLDLGPSVAVLEARLKADNGVDPSPMRL